SSLAVSLPHQYQLVARHLMQRRSGKGHGMVIKQKFSADVNAVGVGVQQYLVSSGMSACVLPDHLKKLGSLHKSFVIGGIQMHLTHMQRLIATIDIAGCPVIEPHLSLQ